MRIRRTEARTLFDSGSLRWLPDDGRAIFPAPVRPMALRWLTVGLLAVLAVLAVVVLLIGGIS